MTTADEILDAALRLYNAHGISQVSFRQIAEQAGISHGNLAYHFRTQAEIVDAIYARMEHEMDDAVYPSGDLGLRHYHELMKRISVFHARYRFFYLDMLEITRRFPRTIRRYRRTITLRFEQYDRLVRQLVDKGLVTPEPERGFHRSLFHSIWVMSTFWLLHKKVLGESHPVIGSGNDVRHVWEIMLPHLTTRGLRELKAIWREEEAGRAGRPMPELYLRTVG